MKNVKKDITKYKRGEKEMVSPELIIIIATVIGAVAIILFGTLIIFANAKNKRKKRELDLKEKELELKYKNR